MDEDEHKAKLGAYNLQMKSSMVMKLYGTRYHDGSTPIRKVSSTGKPLKSSILWYLSKVLSMSLLVWL